MKREDIIYLKCIHCNSDLKITEYNSNNYEILEGEVYCVNCKTEWPIIKGIPRILSKNLLIKLVLPTHKNFFLKYNKKIQLQYNQIHDVFETEKLKTASSFGFEWLSYSKVIKEFQKDWNRYFLPFITPKDLENKVVADIGCGMAKQGYFTSKYASKYIGIDLSEAVDAAYKNTIEFNPLIIQADIYNIPLNGSLIDYYYSIGVLHHLPTPKDAFLRIVNLMKKKSKILIWVYGKYKNKRAFFIYKPLREITTRIPKNLLYILCHIPASITHFFNCLSLILEKFKFKKLAKKIPFYYYRNFPYSFKRSDSFDILATPKQKYFSKIEIEDWFKNGNFREYKIIHDIVQGLKGIAIK